MYKLAPKTHTVLLIEDDAGDQELTHRALAKGIVKVDLRVVADGEEAIEYLLQQGRYADQNSAPSPSIVLIDINMPKLDGKQVLQRIRNTKILRSLPVIVLTTSGHIADVDDMYQIGCNSYFVKPSCVGEYTDMIHNLIHYWLEFTELPKRPFHETVH